MTGFGRGEHTDTEHTFIVEIKAVNHRYNDVVIRMPRILNSLEDRIRRNILSKLSRGRMDVFVTFEDYTEDKSNVQLDKQLAASYAKAFDELGKMFLYDTSERDKFNYVLKSPDVITPKDMRADAETLWFKLEVAITVAVENVMTMRHAEGNNIYQDLILRINLLREHLGKIEARAPQVPIEAQKRINERINDLLKEHATILDHDRLAQEIAILADKTNITEEIVRLKSHFEQFIKTIQSKQAVGRKLDFLVQELNREVNTIASKANDFTITTVAVDMKSEIEKIREQIQNVE